MGVDNSGGGGGGGIIGKTRFFFSKLKQVVKNILAKWSRLVPTRDQKSIFINQKLFFRKQNAQICIELRCDLAEFDSEIFCKVAMKSKTNRIVLSDS